MQAITVMCSMQIEFEQMDPSADFAVQIIEKADLDEDDYLYEFGEYISRMNLEQLII